MNQETYRKLISRQSRGLGAVLLRFFLGAAALIYSTIVWLRNFLYSKGWLKIYHANARVFSVGNITTGGTGKTPLVIWLCKFLQQKQIQCAILTRGYKATQDSRPKTQDQIDEPAILTESCPQVKVIVNPNRVEAAAEAVNEFGAKVLIMDDGFQHRRLHRDLDIVTIDATQPFGYSRMLPAGLLREPVASLKRADAVVITRCDQTTESELSELEEKLRLVNPDMTIARSIYSPICAKSLAGEEIDIEQLKGKKIFAFCGIGNPNAFLNTITELGANLVGSGIYNDHYHYTDSDIDDIHGQANRLEADLILTTQKDWTRTALLTSVKKAIPFAYLAIELKFISGEDKITHLIEYASAGKMLKTKED